MIEKTKCSELITLQSLQSFWIEFDKLFGYVSLMNFTPVLIGTINR